MGPKQNRNWFQIGASLKKEQAGRVLLALLGPPTLMVLLTWAPFGFRMMWLYEEWGLLGFFQNHGVEFSFGLGSAMEQYAARPLAFFPYSLAYAFDPNSFVPMNIMLMLILITTGAAFGYMIWKTLRSIPLAAIGSILILVQPADTLTYAFRSLPMTFSLAIALLAICAVMAALDSSAKRFQLILSMSAIFLFIASVAMYETAIAFVLVPWLLFIIRDGLKPTLQRAKQTKLICAIWFGGTLTYIIFAIWASSQVASYQKLVSDDPFVILTRLPHSLQIGLTRILAGGWFDAARVIITEYRDWTYLAVCVALLGLLVAFTVGFWSKKSREPATKPFLRLSRNKGFSLRQGVLFIVLGTFVALFSYAPFAVSTIYLHTSQRTFIATAVGASMVCLGVLLVVGRYSGLIFALVALTLASLGLGVHLYHFETYVDVSTKQRHVLKSIVEGMPENSESKSVLILDYGNTIGTPWMLHRQNLPSILSYLLGREISNVQICYMPSEEWQQFDSLARTGKCEETPTAWVFSERTVVQQSQTAIEQTKEVSNIPKSSLTTISLDKDGNLPPSTSNSVRGSYLLSSDSSEAKRYRQMLALDEDTFGNFLFKNPESGDSYSWSFGDWWDLPVVTRGSGWRDEEWTELPLDPEASWLSPQESAAWKSLPRASLMFDMVPSQNSYLLTGKFDILLSEEVQKSFHVSINGTELPMKWSSFHYFSGEIPIDTLQSGTNVIGFVSDVDPSLDGLSGKIDWLKISVKR